MTSHTPKSLDQIRENNPILNLNERKLLELARVSDINQLISISQSKKIKWINNDKVLNKDTVEIAQYIITKAEEVLNINIQDIKTFKIENVVKKIWDSLIETKDIESFLIWTYIQKISKQISNIHLRYERKKSFIDKRNLSENNEELTKSNITDPLTWLLNRKGITNYLNDWVEDKNRNWTNYWIMIIDIDYFKDINDNYWHNTWDIALQEISKILVSQFRWYDKVARWWGEEFLVLQKW